MTASSARGGAGTVVLEGLGKRYGDAVAIRDVSLTAAPGEFVTLLGPSGSGKTTTLMAIAGFLEPDAGRILLDGTDITHLPPNQRNLGIVFQHYALFPNMTVFGNVAFPLEVRGHRRDEVNRRVRDALAMVKLDGYDERYPKQLSGGQQQRVALARAIVFAPNVLLMDEPLGALDKNLREHMQSEIRRIHRELGTTVFYVTHDQEEALAMSDKVVVMRDGAIEQMGTPEDLYERPRSAFVAGFIGGSNILAGYVHDRSDDRIVIRHGSGQTFDAPAPGSGGAPGDTARVALRSERIRLAADGEADDGCALSGTVREVTYTGPVTQILVAIGEDDELHVTVPHEHDRAAPAVGDPVTVRWDIRSAVLLSDNG